MASAASSAILAWDGRVAASLADVLAANHLPLVVREAVAITSLAAWRAFRRPLAPGGALVTFGFDIETALAVIHGLYTWPMPVIVSGDALEAELRAVAYALSRVAPLLPEAVIGAPPILFVLVTTADDVVARTLAVDVTSSICRDSGHRSAAAP